MYDPCTARKIARVGAAVGGADRARLLFPSPSLCPSPLCACTPRGDIPVVRDDAGAAPVPPDERPENSPDHRAFCGVGRRP